MMPFGTKIWGYLIAALTAIGAVWGYGYVKKREGKIEANLDAIERDLERAREIEDKADAVDIDGNALERIDVHERLRDD